MSPAAPRLPEVHILGGGVGAITSAFHLSTNGWRNRFGRIVVHQMGWRLGGKGASGRNVAKQNRIEEHGLHVWFGFYENAFRMLAECHAELDAMQAALGKRDPNMVRWETHFPSVESSFHPVDKVGLMEDVARSWRPWVATFPRRPGVPWDRDTAREHTSWPPTLMLADYLEQLVELGRTVVGSLEGGFQDERRHSLEASNAIDAVDKLLGIVAKTLRTPAMTSALHSRDASHQLRQWLDGAGMALEQTLAALDGVIDVIGRRLSRVFYWNEEIRRMWAIVDLVLAVSRGLLADRVVDEAGLDALDDEEFRSWLVRHGATVESVEGPFVRAVVYDLAFAYVRGSARAPECGAGTALRGLHRLLFTYRGSMMWKLNGGMGDVVFMPLYELLVKRGVEFEFFHQVTNLVVERSRITSVGFRQQAANPPVEDNVVEVIADDGRGTGMCWPSQPKTTTDTDARKLESTWWRKAGLDQSIDVSDDFVVLGISVGALPYVASEVIKKSTQWKLMVERVQTVPTQALQLWLTPSTEELGWERDSIVGGYGKPFDTWSDMPGPLAVESHGAGGPRSLAYFCSVFEFDEPTAPDPASDDAMGQHFEHAWKLADDKLRSDIDEFVSRRLHYLWPGASPAAASNPPKLEIEVDRYERVNIDPTERYVLSVPGSSRYRLSPGESGFENLVLAGDWTECTLNAGCVEAAVISGMMAARAIGERAAGSPQLITIIGERRRSAQPVQGYYRR